MQFKGKKILITGGTGFLGSHLVSRLHSDNSVCVVSRDDIQSIKGVEYVSFDVCSDTFLEFLRTKQFDILFHFAGNTNHIKGEGDPLGEIKVNFLATVRILEMLRSLQDKPLFIFPSSAMVYGACPDPVFSETHSLPMPVSQHGVTKYCAERYVSLYAYRYGVPAISLRIFSTYGPGLHRQMVYDFMKKLTIDKKNLVIFGDGSQVRDVTYIDDQIDNLLWIAQQASYHGEVYNLGSGNAYTTLEVAQEVCKALRVESKIDFTNSIRPFDHQRSVADVSLIRTFGCTSKIPLEDGIKKTVDWYKTL